jgi:hypothetical protein
MVGVPVAATRLAGREMVDAGTVMAGGRTEDEAWADEATVCSVVGKICGAAAAAALLEGNDPWAQRHMQLHVPSESGVPTTGAGTRPCQLIVVNSRNLWWTCLK